ncbi:hypothetical protein [Nitrospira sp. BLG_2]|uniref:hypothetical protein n=1 Tax=Nitrospira sp. BLG_2 TaxID=3397507 RepID=UPI003B9BF6E7
MGQDLGQSLHLLYDEIAHCQKGLQEFSGEHTYSMVTTFMEWLKVKESTAFKRERRAAALGLGPSIPDAEINSHSTARAWEKDAIVKRNKKKKKKGKDSKLPPK